MDADRAALLDELAHAAATPTERRLNDRVEILGRLIESDPPRRHSYPMLSMVMAILYLFGVLLMLTGIVGGIMAISPPTLETAVQSDGVVHRSSEPVLDLTARLALGLNSILAFTVGLYSMIGAQGTQLMLDLQGNADRQSSALHGLFYLMLSQRKDGSHDDPN